MKWRKDKSQPKDASWVFSTKPIPRWDGETHSLLVTSKETSWSEQADVICDGQNDDVNIQKAIDRLATVDGEVLMLDGTFHLTRPIVLESRMRATIIGNVFFAASDPPSYAGVMGRP